MLYLKITKKKESFWVKNLIREGQVWQGDVDNDLINSDIKKGDKIKFKNKDIIHWWVRIVPKTI
jgi:uncharacterized protein YegJ (DUF2314 family)